MSKVHFVHSNMHYDFLKILFLRNENGAQKFCPSVLGNVSEKGKAKDLLTQCLKPYCLVLTILFFAI